MSSLMNKVLMILFFCLSLFIYPKALFSQNGTLLELAREELKFVQGVSLWREAIFEAPSPSMVYSQI